MLHIYARIIKQTLLYFSRKYIFPDKSYHFPQLDLDVDFSFISKAFKFTITGGLRSLLRNLAVNFSTFY